MRFPDGFRDAGRRGGWGRGADASREDAGVQSGDLDADLVEFHLREAELSPQANVVAGGLSPSGGHHERELLATPPEQIGELAEVIRDARAGGKDRTADRKGDRRWRRRPRHKRA